MSRQTVSVAVVNGGGAVLGRCQTSHFWQVAKRTRGGAGGPSAMAGRGAAASDELGALPPMLLSSFATSSSIMGPVFMSTDCDSDRKLSSRRSDRPPKGVPTNRVELALDSCSVGEALVTPR